MNALARALDKPRQARWMSVMGFKDKYVA